MVVTGGQGWGWLELLLSTALRRGGLTPPVARVPLHLFCCLYLTTPSSETVVYTPLLDLNPTPPEPNPLPPPPFIRCPLRAFLLTQQRTTLPVHNTLTPTPTPIQPPQVTNIPAGVSGDDVCSLLSAPAEGGGGGGGGGGGIIVDRLDIVSSSRAAVAAAKAGAAGAEAAAQQEGDTQVRMCVCVCACLGVCCGAECGRGRGCAVCV